MIQTPTIDAIARNGVRFTRAYSECPICIPARRTLMTGTTTRTHGDRIFGTVNRMPAVPTLAHCFRDAGYQTFAVGKLHVYPPRDRIGFDDVLLSEEGRPHLGGLDDYEIFLADRGYPGQQYLHGMNNNNYMHRPWHLPEDCHVTNWTSMQMARTIKRRDPTRPAFWCVSYTPPHPPLVPLASYVDYYRAFEIPEALLGDWSEDDAALPVPLRMNRAYYGGYRGQVLTEVRRAFYALCTHIDHQLRLVIGTLREEGILDDTIVLIAADHGEMLGDFGLFAKRTYYEGSGCVPMVLMGRAGDQRVGHHRVDDRLVGLAGPDADPARPRRHSGAAELRRPVDGRRAPAPDPVWRLPGERQRNPHAARRPPQADLVPGRQPRPAVRPRGGSGRAAQSRG